MKIDNAEIERLMRVVEENLRLRWEKASNHGRSLITTLNERGEALGEIESNKKRGSLIRKLMALFGAFTLLMVLFTSNSGIGYAMGVTIRSVPFVLFIGSICLLSHLEHKKGVIELSILDYDYDFSQFQESVISLDCLSLPYQNNETIDRFRVFNRLVRAAYQVLDAKAIFESLKSTPNADWHRVFDACSEIAHYEKTFDGIWRTAIQDFQLVLDKKAIFDQAAKELKKDNEARVPTKK